MKILYGVPGEGMGHATRSKVVLEHLLASGHHVRIVSSGRAFTFLEKAFPGFVSEIEGFHLAYKKAGVDKLQTLVEILKGGSGSIFRNFKRYRKIAEDFLPDAVVSDFESFSFLFALHHRLPIISIDNMQIISRTKLEIPIPKEEKENSWLTRQIIKPKCPDVTLI